MLVKEIVQNIFKDEMYKTFAILNREGFLDGFVKQYLISELL